MVIIVVVVAVVVVAVVVVTAVVVAGSGKGQFKWFILNKFFSEQNHMPCQGLNLYLCLE